MDERNPRQHPHDHDDEAAVRDLLQGAARRPELPAAELEAMTAVARQEWRRTVERVRAEERHEHRGGGLRRVAVAAAVTLAAVLAGWWLLRPAGVPVPVEVARVEWLSGAVTVTSAAGGEASLAGGAGVEGGATVATGATDRAALVLADGTAVRLDAATRLTLDASDRLRLARGAVYLDSGAAGGDGLEVWTPLGVARDVGTRFSVRVTPANGTGPHMTVQVRDGAVEVAADGDGDPLRLAGAGRQVVLSGDGAVRETAIDPWGAEWEWVLQAAPGFAVEGRSLKSFLAWVERETGWEVRYADPALEAEARDIVLHGDPGRLRPDRAPLVLLPAAGLEGEIEAGVLTVRRGG